MTYNRGAMKEMKMNEKKCGYPNCGRRTRSERYKWCDRCRRALRLAKEGKVKEGLALYKEG